MNGKIAKRTCVLLLTALTMAACGGSGGGDETPPPGDEVPTSSTGPIVSSVTAEGTEPRWAILGATVLQPPARTDGGSAIARSGFCYAATPPGVPHYDESRCEAAELTGDDPATLHLALAVHGSRLRPGEPFHAWAFLQLQDGSTVFSAVATGTTPATPSQRSFGELSSGEAVRVGGLWWTIHDQLATASPDGTPIAELEGARAWTAATGPSYVVTRIPRAPGVWTAHVYNREAGMVCPAGWRLPTLEDVQVLFATYPGAGEALEAIDWDEEVGHVVPDGALGFDRQYRIWLSDLSLQAILLDEATSSFELGLHRTESLAGWGLAVHCVRPAGP